LLGSIALHWGWNSFAGEMLSQQPMRFEHAFALALLLLSVSSVFPVAWRLLGDQARYFGHPPCPSAPSLSASSNDSVAFLAIWQA
jgi:hypothetical protein